MIYSVILRLCAFFFAITVLTYCKPSDPMPDTVVQREDTLTIARLRSLNTAQIPSRIRITDPGSEGVFSLDQADNSSADNTGIILVTVKGHRYVREFSGPASLTWFGIDPSDADIGPDLQKAINATDELIFADGKYKQLTSVRLRSNLTIRANPGKAIIELPKTYMSLGYFVNAADSPPPMEHVLIDGLTWNVTSREDGQFGAIYIDGPSVKDFTVQNCASNDAASKDSTNWMTLKIQAGKTAEGIVVRNNTVRARRMACEIFNHDNYGIYAGKNIAVTGNIFYDCHFGLSLSGPLEQIVVDNNYVKNCSLFGIEIAGAARSVSITNNKFEGVFDKFLEGSNDGGGNGSVVGGMVITGNTTVGAVQGGMQLFNGGTVTFSKNNFNMSGMLELAHSTAGGTFTENTIESLANKAIICDNSPNNTFTGNTISNKGSNENQATFMAYGSKAVNNVLNNNKIIKGNGGKPYDAVLGGSCQASMNHDEAGNLIP